MKVATDPAAFDLAVRRHIYNEIIRRAVVPTSAQTADALRSSTEDVRDSFRRMKEAHILVLQEDDEILMANPFSAVPTAFLVRAANRSWWGNCIWDALGIAAMVRSDATITTGCGDCNDAMRIEIEGGASRVAMGEGIVHFSVPAKRWWDNIKFT